MSGSRRSGDNRKDPGKFLVTELTNIDDAALSWLDNLAFQYRLRKYQKEIIELCKKKIEAGEKELHIVAPPGSGKTILGYEIISQFKCPSLVLCPNNTIATQWNAKLEDFFSADDIDFARPEVLTGLFTQTVFATGDMDCVVSPFGAGSC